MRSSAAVVVLVVLGALAAGCAGDDEPEEVGAAGSLEQGLLAASGSPESLAAAPGVAAEGITVTGTGSAEAVPDVAEWSFGVQTSADTAEAALAANSEAMDRVVAALRETGIDEDDLRTEQVSVYPRTSDDGLTITGYDASNSVRATIRSLDRAGATVDAAVAAGANQVYGPTLTLSDGRAQYAAAVEEAFDDARERAEAIAEHAGLSLGAPVAIVEGGGAAIPFGRDAMAEAAAADVSVQPGTQEVGATLTVTFAVG
jgi:uncharacterized protein